MKKLLALLLALALVVSYAAVFSASEVPADPTPVDSAPESPVETESLLTEDLKKQIVPEAEVPDLIDYSVAVAEKYVCRAYWEENDLNEVVFLKSDGTLARYYFAIPVKYEENGEIFDKKPALVERETLLNNLYRYELTAQNDTAFYCPDNLTHGFLYQGGDMEVALRPITQSEYDFLRGHANAGDLVLPGNILPEGYDSQAVTGTAQSALSVTDEATTAARYVLSTEGEQVNSAFSSQDILSAVPSYNGFQLQLDLAEGALTQTVYFELDSELLPIPTEGGLLLCDQKGNPVGILGDLLSESGVQNDIPWTVTESLSGTYLLSATLPRNGQTYTLSTTNLFDYLLDASIYSADQENYGQSANLWVGYHQSYSGIERVLIRPNNWYFTESAAPNQVVQSATLTIRDITVTSYEANIEARPFTGNVWTENEVCWNQASGNSYGPVLDSNPVSSAIGWNEGYYYSYDITSLVQNWYTGISNWQTGLMICWDIDHLATSTMEKCFASSQYSNENYRPRLEITTAALSTIESGVYELESYAAGAGYYLSAEPVAVDNYATTGAAETQPLSLDTKQTDSLHQKWRITHIQNNYYTIRPYHYTPAGLYTSGSAVVTAALGTSDLWEEVSSGFLWYIEATPLPGGGYGNCFSLYPYGSGFSLGVYNSSSSWGVYAGDGYGGTEHKWSFTEEENPAVEARLYSRDGGSLVNYVPVVTVFADDNATLSAMGYYLSVCAPNNYSMEATSCDWEVVGNGATIDYSYGGISFLLSGAGQFQINVYLSSSTEADASLRVYFDTAEDYYIRNLGISKNIEHSNDGVELSPFDGSDSQEWHVQKWSSSTDCYTISRTVNGVTWYLSLEDESDLSDGASVTLKQNISGITDGMKWQLYYYQPSGAIIADLKIASIKRDEDNNEYLLSVKMQDTQTSLVVKRFNSSQNYQSWEVASVVPSTRSIDFVLYADGSFQSAYPNGGYVQRILEYMEKAKWFYARNFGVFINYSGVGTYQSSADGCEFHGDDASELCECGGDCASHHKNINNYFDEITHPDEDNDEGNPEMVKEVYFTKHKMCDGTIGENLIHKETDILGFAQHGGKYAMVREKDVFFGAGGINETATKSKTLITLIHEIGHLFSAKDHNDPDANDGDDSYTTEEIIQMQGMHYDSLCIYGEDQWDARVVSRHILCFGCANNIRAGIENFLVSLGVVES